MCPRRNNVNWYRPANTFFSSSYLLVSSEVFECIYVYAGVLEPELSKFTSNTVKSGQFALFGAHNHEIVHVWTIDKKFWHLSYLSLYQCMQNYIIFANVLKKINVFFNQIFPIFCTFCMIGNAAIFAHFWCIYIAFHWNDNNFSQTLSLTIMSPIIMRLLHMHACTREWHFSFSHRPTCNP